MTFSTSEVIWYILVPLIMVVLLIFRKWVKKIGFTECLFPVSAISIEMIGQLLVQYSVWPYILFSYTIIAIIMFFYNYKTDYYFTFTQFFRRVFRVVSAANVLVWLGLVIFRVVSQFL